ncbi:MAG: EAL domain-containing protein, partial [Gammaproteobacteria bacterium]
QAPTWLHQTLSSTTMTLSSLFIDAASGRPVILLGYSLRDVAGKPDGVLGIAVDLLTYDSVHYQAALKDARLPAGSVLTVISAAGRVIARWPNASKWVGTDCRHVPVVAQILAGKTATAMKSVGLDGVSKLYGVAPIPGTGWNVYVGIPAALVMSPINALLYRDLALGAAIAVLAVLVAQYLGRSISAPIGRLCEAARTAAEGRMDLRVPERGPREIAAMGVRFNDLLASRTRAEEALTQEKERAEVTLASIGDAVVATDPEGVVTFLNPVAEQLSGWSAAQARGQPLFDVVRLVDSASGNPVHRPLQQAVELGYLVGVGDNTTLINRHGAQYVVADCVAPIRNRHGTLLGTVLVFRDMSKARELSSKLSWQATHDALTGLFNRTEFEHRVSRALDETRQTPRQHALLYLDLDQFKIVNDTCGHVAGDELLQRLSALLLARVRDDDTLARLGGDEFGVLLEHCPPDQALRIADEIREAVQDFRFAWHGKIFRVGVSIGVVSIDRDSETLAKVLSAADRACYAAKETGRNRVHVFQPDNVELVRHLGEMEWVQRLSSAFEEERFLLYAQPIVPLEQNTDRPQYLEILLRLRDEGGQILLPNAFLPAAERYNLIPTVDRWVLRTLFATLGDHQGTLDPHTIFSVNISGPSLSEDLFLDFVLDLLADPPVAPWRICFEITESAAIDNLPQAKRFLSVLKNIGCHFALDDFGSGLSSFTYLKNLPVDHIKIAGSFVYNMHIDSVDAAMVESINNIGHVMALTTVAEGAEHQTVVEQLRRLGVDYVQGYAIASPILLDQYLGGVR